MPDPFEDWLKPISPAPAGIDDWASKIPDPFPDQERRMQEARVWANQKRGGEKEFGFGLGLRLRTRDLSLPFEGAAKSVARGIAGVENDHEKRQKAQQAFSEGKATDEQLARLALYEYEDARNKSLGTAASIAQGVAQAAPVVGEALVGGQAVKGLGQAIGLGAKIAPATTTLGRMGQSAGIQAAATPLTPGLWLDESQQRAAENGGNWYDPKNVAAPMVKAAFQNAIMGHLGEGTKGLGLAKRIGAGAALMPAEQAGADALTTLAEKGWKQAGMDEKWATKTEWGTIGQFMKGESGEGWKSLATQATLGALFAGFHGQKSDPVGNLGKAVDSLAKADVPPDLAGRVIAESLNRPPETIKNPEVKAFVESIIDLKPVEAIKPRSSEADAEPVRTAPEAQKTAPAKPQTASQALEALFRNDAPVDPNRPPDPLPYSNIPKEAFKYEFEVTPQKPEKKKGLGKNDLVTQKQKAAEEKKAKEEAASAARAKEQADHAKVLEDFFSKPLDQIRAENHADIAANKAEAKLGFQADAGFDDMMADMMGMKLAEHPLGGGFIPKEGLVVANIGKGGKIYYGRPGDIHASLSERYPHADRGDWEAVGFAGPDGKFLTREQALEFAQKEGKVKTSENMKGQLDAMDYRESANIDQPERRVAEGTGPEGVERRRPSGLKLGKAEPITIDNARVSEVGDLDKFGKDHFRIDITDSEGAKVGELRLGAVGDTLHAPVGFADGLEFGKGRGKDQPFGSAEIMSLVEQVAMLDPGAKKLVFTPSPKRIREGVEREFNLDKIRERVAKRAEKDALQYWEEAGHEAINDHLRGAFTRAGRGEGPNAEEMKRIVSGLDSAIEKSDPLKQDTTVYRGVGKNQPDVDPGYTAVTTDRATAEKFAKKHNGTVQELILPAGTKAAKVPGIESELLLARGTDIAPFKQETPSEPVPAEPAPEGTRVEETRPDTKGLGARKEAAVPAPAPRREVGGRVIGSDTKVKVPGTKAIDGRYEVRELRDVIASDTPGESGGFRTREDYPEGLQPRKYTGNQAEMEKVRRFAQEMDTAQYLTDDPNATGGPPTITPDGIVLNGNGRQMSLEEAARTGTYAKYKADLASKAERFGIDPKAVESMKEPVLYRVVNMDAKSDIARDFARRGNITNTQAQTPERRAASLGGVIDDAVLDSLKITGDETFAQAVNTDKGDKFRSKLREKLPPNVVEEFFNPDDTLTDAGKVFVGDMLATKVVPIEVLERIKGINKNLANAVESAAPQLIALNRNTKVNPVPALNEALDFLSRNPEITDMSGVSNALDQRDIFGKTQTISPAGRMMVDFVMQTAGQGRTKVFRERLVEMAGDLKNVGKSNLFGDVGPKLNETEKIAEVLGVKPRTGAKFLPKEPEGFGRTMTPEERAAGQVSGGAPEADLPPVEGGLKEIALANERVDAERASLGLPPLMEPARRANAEVWDQAMARIAKDPNVSADLVRELSKKMRATTVEENALLAHRMLQFDNEYGRTIRRANDAARKGNWPEFDRLSLREKELKSQIDELGKLTQKAGTEWGRAGQFRRQLVREDYSLGRMMDTLEYEKRAPLTPEERQKVQDQHDRIKALEERLRDFEAKEAAEADVIDLQPAEQKGLFQKAKEWLGSLFPRQRPTLGAAKKSKTWEFADRMEQDAAKELASIYGSGKLFSGFDPTGIPALAKYTAAKIIKSGLTFADFSSQIIARFGDAVKPHIKEIWDGAQKHVEIGRLDKVDAQVELKKTKGEYTEMADAFKRKNQSVGRKLWEGTKETNNLMRAIQTAWDVSAVGRQGIVLGLTNPTKVPAAFREMVQAIRSERGYERNQQEIMNRRNAIDYRLAELEFTDHNADPTKQEESLMGRYVQKLPGLAASSRAFNGYLNRLRADVFDAMTLNATSTGPDRLTELKAAANWINAVTGRGKTGYRRIDDAAAHMAQVLFSPRHALSRFQVLSGQPFWGAGTWKAKKMIAKEYAKYAIGMAAVYGLAKAVLGKEAEIEKDPRSSDFGKIRIGRTRIDPLAGFSQSAVVATRLGRGESKMPGTNEVKDLRGPGHKFKDPSSMDVAGRFVRNKMSPLAGEVADKLFPEFTPPGSGPLTEATGKKKGLGGWAIRQADKFQPLTAGDIYDAFKEHGIPRATAISLLNLLGWGSQVHEKQPRPK